MFCLLLWLFLQVFLGWPNLRAPWGSQSSASAVFSMAPVGFLKVWPIQFYFLFFIWTLFSCWFVTVQRSSCEIISGHLMFMIQRKH
jgi:hypothetical protein